MKKLIAVLAVVAVALCAAAPVEAQSRSRGSGGGSFGSAYLRGLGFSLGARTGGFGGPFGSAGLVSPFASPFRSSFYSPLRVSPFVDPLPFRVAPLIRSRTVRFVDDEPLIEFIESPRTERIIIIR